MHADDTNEHELFCAWVAGFVDGEGCLTIARSRSSNGNWSYRPLLCIVNTVRAPLAEIRRRAGVGALNLITRKAPRRHVYQYAVHGENAQQFIEAIRPYLRIKTAQADMLLQFRARPQSLGRGTGPAGDPHEWARLQEPQVALWVALRELNRRGVPLPDTG